MKFTRIGLFACLLGGMYLVSCSSKSNEGANSDEFKNAEQSLQEQIEKVVYDIPSPTEIPYLLEATGADFNQTLVNDRKKVDQYTSQSEKAALNLGVFAADIGYLASYDKTQNAIDCMNSCKALADNLGIIGAFDIEMLQRFESNIANKDSLASLLNATINQADKYLRDDKRNKLAALIVTGSFIEGLYISTGVVKSYPRNILPDDQRNLILTPLMRIILEQEKSVEELLRMLGSSGNEDPIPAIMADLTTLQASYRALNIEEQIKNNRADLVLTDKNLAEITATVEKLRNSITR